MKNENSSTAPSLTRAGLFLVLVAVSVFLAVIVGTARGLASGLTAAFVLDASVYMIGSQVFQVPSFGSLFTPTLITSILTGKVAEAFRTKVPEIAYFSVDFGRNGSEFAAPVKFGQEVISHLALVPTAEAFTPGSGLGSGTVTNVKDLIVDTKVKIDMAAKVSIKLPTVDSVTYLLEPAFKQAMLEAGKSLGRYVIGKVAAKITAGNFSHEMLGTVAAVEIETLGDARAKLNKQGAGDHRFILAETDWCKNLSRDPVIASGDYHGQRTGADPYITLVNIEGFENIREFPNMPTNTAVLGTFTAVAATNVITVSAAHGKAIGDRLRFTSTVTLPGGMSVDTDYFVLTVPSSTTMTISATVGGAVLDITDTGTGTHTIKAFEGVNAFAAEKRAIHIAFRPLLDNQEFARMLGIPETMNVIPGQEAETGLAFTWYLWKDGSGTNPTGDIFATCVVAFGIRAGREITGATTPAGEAADSGMDPAGLRIVEALAA